MTFKYLSADLKNGTWDRIVALIAASVVGVAFIAGLVLIVKKVCGKLQLRAEALRQKTSEEQAILGTDGMLANLLFVSVFAIAQVMVRDLSLTFSLVALLLVRLLQ